jgi:D-cysteine desulfhydrase family pyridoxal phosphate-dependent enzyme
MTEGKLEPLHLAHLPTPIDHLPRISKKLGILEIQMKRDDLTGLAFGGNKTRKLEYLLGDASAKGARTLITRGAAQSNHCRQTAAAAARYGFDCVLVLTGDKPTQLNGNLLLDQLMGAKTFWTQDQDPEGVLKSQFKHLEQTGAKPYLIPYGGSNEIGIFAFVQAIRELITQAPDLDRIVLATSSGGTQAGICLGASIYNFRGKITGISVDLESTEIQAKVASLANQTSQWLDRQDHISVESVQVIDDFLGGGYGVVGTLEKNAIDLFAREEGILLDPVYTARAAGGMLELIRNGTIDKDETVLFWHTGGTPSLFAYADILAD